MRYVPGLCGRLLVATGIVHVALGLGLWARPIADTVRDGVVNAVDPIPERQAWFWYTLTGWGLIVLGQVAGASERREGAPPRALGWHLLGMGAVGVLLMPVSGFWIVLPQGVLALVLSRRAGRGANEGTPPRSLRPTGGRRSPTAAA